MTNPSGLSTQPSGLWTPRQQMDPLAPPSSVLVAQYDPWCHLVCLQMLSLCHVEEAPSPPHRQAHVARCPPHLDPGPILELILWWIFPNSDSNTCVLVTVDRFSKAYKFIPLRGLPTALETAECLFNHISRNFSLPEEIISDQGPQFNSHVWKAFFWLLGVTVNLSLATILRQMARLSIRSRSFTSCHTAMTTSTAGAASSVGLRTPKTHSAKTPPGWLLSSVYSLSNPCTLPGQESPVRFQLWTTGFRASERVWDSAHIHHQCAVQRHKTFADARQSNNPTYQPGDKVWLSSRDLCLSQPWVPAILVRSPYSHLIIDHLHSVNKASS